MDLPFDEWIALPKTKKDYPCIDMFGERLISLGASWDTFQHRLQGDIVRDLDGVPLLAAKDIVAVIKSEIYRCRQAPLAIFWDLDGFPSASRANMLREYSSLRSLLEEFGTYEQSKIYTSSIHSDIYQKLDMGCQNLTLVECRARGAIEVTAQSMIEVDATRFALENPNGATLCFIIAPEVQQNYTYLFQSLGSQSGSRNMSRTILIMTSEQEGCRALLDVCLDWKVTVTEVQDQSEIQEDAPLVSEDIPRPVLGVAEAIAETSISEQRSESSQLKDESDHFSQSQQPSWSQLDSPHGSSRGSDDGSSVYCNDDAGRHVLDIIEDAKDILNEKSTIPNTMPEIIDCTSANDLTDMGRLEDSSSSNRNFMEASPFWFYNPDLLEDLVYPENEDDMDLLMRAFDDTTRLVDGCAHKSVVSKQIQKLDSERFISDDSTYAFISTFVECGVLYELDDYGMIMLIQGIPMTLNVCQQLPLTEGEFSALSDDQKQNLSESSFILMLDAEFFQGNADALSGRLVSFSPHGRARCFLTFQSEEEVALLLKDIGALIAGTLVPGRVFDLDAAALNGEILQDIRNEGSMCCDSESVSGLVNEYSETKVDIPVALPIEKGAAKNDDAHDHIISELTFSPRSTEAKHRPSSQSEVPDPNKRIGHLTTEGTSGTIPKQVQNETPGPNEEKSCTVAEGAQTLSKKTDGMTEVEDSLEVDFTWLLGLRRPPSPPKRLLVSDCEMAVLDKVMNKDHFSLLRGSARKKFVIEQLQSASVLKAFPEIPTDSESFLKRAIKDGAVYDPKNLGRIFLNSGSSSLKLAKPFHDSKVRRAMSHLIITEWMRVAVSRYVIIIPPWFNPKDKKFWRPRQISRGEEHCLFSFSSAEEVLNAIKSTMTLLSSKLVMGIAYGPSSTIFQQESAPASVRINLDEWGSAKAWANLFEDVNKEFLGSLVRGRSTKIVVVSFLGRHMFQNERAAKIFLQCAINSGLVQESKSGEAILIPNSPISLRPSQLEHSRWDTKGEIQAKRLNSQFVIKIHIFSYSQAPMLWPHYIASCENFAYLGFDSEKIVFDVLNRESILAEGTLVRFE